MFEQINRLFGINKENQKRIYAFLSGFSLTFSLITLLRGLNSSGRYLYFISGTFLVIGGFYMYRSHQPLIKIRGLPYDETARKE